VLAYLATSWEQHDARIEVARLGARDLVEANWSSIKAVAEELLRKQALDAAAVKAIVLRCDRDMDSLTYERRRKERHKMGRIQAKRIGPVAYYLNRDARSYQVGKPALHTKFGPYASMKEAEAKREEEEVGGRPGYQYHYRIAVEPIIIPK
jgi:hypothetical protein